MEKLVDFCKDYISNHIRDIHGQTVIGYDLADAITQHLNKSSYSLDEAKAFLNDWWDDADKYFQYEKKNLSKKDMHNPFGDPCEYVSNMVKRGVENILLQCESIDDLEWGESIAITDYMIYEINDELSTVTEIDWH